MGMTQEPEPLDAYGELAVKNRTLQLKIDRIQVVLEATDAYFTRVRQAFVATYAIALRHATPEERRELERLRGTVL